MGEGVKKAGVVRTLECFSASPMASSLKVCVRRETTDAYAAGNPTPVKKVETCVGMNSFLSFFKDCSTKTVDITPPVVAKKEEPKKEEPKKEVAKAEEKESIWIRAMRNYGDLKKYMHY